MLRGAPRRTGTHAGRRRKPDGDVRSLPISQPPIMDGQSWQHVPGLWIPQALPCGMQPVHCAQSVTWGKQSRIQWRDVTEQNKLPVSRGRPVNKLASVDLASLTVEHIAPVNT